MLAEKAWQVNTSLGQGLKQKPDRKPPEGGMYASGND